MVVKNDTPWMTAREVAKYLGISPDSVYDAAHEKGLRHVRLGPGTIRFRREWVDEWVERHAEPAPVEQT